MKHCSGPSRSGRAATHHSGIGATASQGSGSAPSPPVVVQPRRLIPLSDAVASVRDSVASSGDGGVAGGYRNARPRGRAGLGVRRKVLRSCSVVRLLEREDELGVLVDAVQDAAAGRGSVVLVAGEAGIGKSSLLRELRERTGERVTFLIGACEPLSVPVPLAPLRELVEAAGGGDLIDLGSDDRLVLVRRVASVLAERAPVVAVIEDVHWADPLTARSDAAAGAQGVADGRGDHRNVPRRRGGG